MSVSCARHLRPVSKPLNPVLVTTYCARGNFSATFWAAGKHGFKYLSFKMTLLIALIFSKWVCELLARSIHHSFLQFSPGLPKVMLLPNNAFMPKVSGNYNVSSHTACIPAEVHSFQWDTVCTAATDLPCMQRIACIGFFQWNRSRKPQKTVLVCSCQMWDRNKIHFLTIIICEWSLHSI